MTAVSSALTNSVPPLPSQNQNGTGNYGWDAALMKLTAATPFTINGLSNGFWRWFTPLEPADFVGAPYPAYGSSFTAPPPNPVPESWLGTQNTATFTVVPYPGVVLDDTKNQELQKRGPAKHKFAVERGGGLTPTSKATDIIPVSGDSGGPMIDSTSGAIMGILEAGISTGKFANEILQPEVAWYSAASGFRDYARTVLGYAAPGISFDADGDGKPDTFSYSSSGTNTVVLSVTFGSGGSASWNTGLPLPDGTLGGFFPGDFNGDGKQDLIGHVNGTPLYFNGAQTFNFISNVHAIGPTGWNIAALPSNPLSYFTVGDFNKDSVADVASVREDGSETIYLGEKGMSGQPGPGLGVAASLAPRGFKFYTANEDESFAISAPGLGSGGGNFNAVVGYAYVFSHYSTCESPAVDVDAVDPFSLTSIKTNATVDTKFPDSELGDQFGAAIAWGQFDDDIGRHGLAIAAPGKTVSGAQDAGVVVYMKNTPGAVDPKTCMPNDFTTAAVAFDATTFSGTPGSPASRWFGAQLAAGDFDGDGKDDLAISGGTSVFVIHGGISGLAPGNKKTTLPMMSKFGASELENRVLALTSGDFNCDGYEDLAIGLPNATIAGVVAAGAVEIAYGGPDGLKVPVANAVSPWQRIEESISGIGDGAVSADRFGIALAAGNFNGDSSSGRPCIDLAISSHEAAGIFPPGAVNVVYGSAGGLSPSGSQILQQGGTVGGVKILGGGSAHDLFGGSLAVTNADRDGFDDLMVGAYMEGQGVGAAHVLRGGTSGITAQGQAYWKQGEGPIPDTGEHCVASPNPDAPFQGDYFGYLVGGTSTGVLTVSAAFETLAAIPVS